MNLPNALTLLRLLMVPVFGVLLLWDSGASATARGWAAAVFIAASVTDIADGHIARQRGQVTRFGTIADPIADKVLTGVALIGLSVLGLLPWWVSILLLAREIGVTLLRFWVLRSGVIPASRGGKAKTLALTVAITMFLLPLPAEVNLVRDIIMGIAVVLSMVTGIDYVMRALDLRGLAARRSTTYDQVSRIIATLTERHQTIAVAESLTGGLLGAAFTGVPGASAVFRGGVTAYATDLKAGLLHVDQSVLDAGGAVQVAVAAQMAEGVRALTGTTYGVATTGVAGPDPQDGRPPGVVCVGIAGPSGSRGVEVVLEGGRDEVRAATVRLALGLMAEELGP